MESSSSVNHAPKDEIIAFRAGTKFNEMLHFKLINFYLTVLHFGLDFAKFLIEMQQDLYRAK